VRAGPFAGVAALTLLAACASVPVERPSKHPKPIPTPTPTLRPIDLVGWQDEDHAAALKAYQAGCGRASGGADQRACTAARAMGPAGEVPARRFFETRFRVALVATPDGGPGLLTSYFAPEYEARETPDEIFSAPLRPKPADLVRGADGRYPPYLERAEIEQQAGPALAYLRPEDLFFLQIQGSGYLDFPNGRRKRAAYAADNGRPFVGIARPMVERGILAPNRTSGEAIRGWLADHRGEEAQRITDLNPRYVFFALGADDDGHPAGAAGVPLPPGRSIAIDPAHHGFGELIWLDAEAPALAGAQARYRRLAVTLDTGGAIKGPVRADLYAGRGDTAGAEAGRVKHQLRMYRFVPMD
jgi:membrane-bound lytic murein transglycosylase A